MRLAGLGFHVTLLDSSPEMLDLANRTAREAGVAASIALQKGDASQAANFFPGEFFDVILCTTSWNLRMTLAPSCAALRN